MKNALFLTLLLAITSNTFHKIQPNKKKAILILPSLKSTLVITYLSINLRRT